MDATTAEKTRDGEPTATRSDLQLGRRLFHLANGVAIATAYALLFSRSQVVHLFGIVACLVYILDRVRMHYPELLERAPWVNHGFFRAEEQVREAAMTPFAIGVLLTILTFPKPISLIAIYALGIADPLSAVVGITWGRRHVVPRKTIEGSLAFFFVTAAIAGLVLAWTTPVTPGVGAAIAVLVAAIGTICEALPLRIDDNLTIPLAVGFAAWIACALAGVPI
jgi:dolichol kinase